jgi:hypothetical protein
MVLDTAGIAAGWQVETMPGTRLMNDAIVMPDGNILFINGVATGVSACQHLHVVSFGYSVACLGCWLWRCCRSDRSIECR